MTISLFPMKEQTPAKGGPQLTTLQPTPRRWCFKQKCPASPASVLSASYFSSFFISVQVQNFFLVSPVFTCYLKPSIHKIGSGLGLCFYTDLNTAAVLKCVFS